MRRFVMVAVAGIALVFAGALAVILFATAPRPPSQGELPPVEGRQQAAAPAGGPPPAAPTALPPLPAPAQTAPAAPAVPLGWEQARTLQIPEGVAARELSPPLAPCFAQVGRGGGGSVLRLSLEGIPGGLRVVDAQPVSREPGIEGLVSCAQDILRDRKISMGGFQTGERFEASYVLNDGSSAKPASGDAPGTTPARTFRRQRGRGPGVPAVTGGLP